MTTYIIQKQAMGKWFALPSTEKESLLDAALELQNYQREEPHSKFRLLECNVIAIPKNTIFTTQEKGLEIL